jgi:hypothetical protein
MRIEHRCSSDLSAGCGVVKDYLITSVIECHGKPG